MKGAKISTISPMPGNLPGFIKTFGMNLTTLHIGEEVAEIEGIAEMTDRSIMLKLANKPRPGTDIDAKKAEMLENTELYITFNFDVKKQKEKVVLKAFVDLIGPKHLESIIKVMRRTFNWLIAKTIKREVQALIDAIMSGEIPEAKGDFNYGRLPAQPETQASREIASSSPIKSQYISKKANSKYNVLYDDNEPPKIEARGHFCPYCGYPLKHARQEICPGCKAKL